jgi:Cold shock proteins
METGKVKFFNDQKGFGFIVSDTGQEVFVHFTGILAEGHKTLAEGDIVQFDIVTEERGDKAINVKVI